MLPIEEYDRLMYVPEDARDAAAREAFARELAAALNVGVELLA